MEEVEYLWRQGKKAEADTLVTALLDAFPDNTDLIQMAVSIKLERKNFKRAHELMQQLEVASGKPVPVPVFSEEGAQQDFTQEMTQPTSPSPFESAPLASPPERRESEYVPDYPVPYPASVPARREARAVDGAARKVEEARLLWKLGKNVDADALITSLLKTYPDNVELLKLAVTVKLAMGDLKQAQELTETLRSVSESDNLRRRFDGSKPAQMRQTDKVARRVQRGWLLWNAGKKGKAEALVRSLLRQYPNNIGLLKLAVAIRLDRGDIKGAQELLKKIERVASMPGAGTVMVPGSLAAADLDIGRSIEEAWLLWKLGRKDEADALVTMLLRSYPRDPELLLLAITVKLNRGDIKWAQQLLDTLGSVIGRENPLYRDIASEVYLKLGKSDKACELVLGLCEQFPTRESYRRRYAELLSDLKKWPQAKEAYAKLDRLTLSNSDVAWDYHEAVSQGATAVRSDYMYYHGPQSLREYEFVQRASFWPFNNLQMEGRFFEEGHKMVTDGINEKVTGHGLAGRLVYNPQIEILGGWEAAYNRDQIYNELFLGGDFRHNDIFHTTVGFTYNRLVRDPIEGLLTQSTYNSLVLAEEVLLSDELTVGNIFTTNWYNINPAFNPFTGDSDFGYKVFNDTYFSYLFYKKPDISFNMHFYPSHWHKPFADAQDIVDYIEDERVIYGGFHFSHRFQNSVEARSDIRDWRDFNLLRNQCELYSDLAEWRDVKRAYWSTIFTIGTNYWLTDYFAFNLQYMYGYNINGITGQGNASEFRGQANVYF